MTFETWLNCVWLVSGAIALGAVVRASLRKNALVNASPAWLHVCGVALIVAALFPYISATDDVLRIQHMNVEHGKDHSSKKAATDDLVRLYEAMDSPVVCEVHHTTPEFILLCLVILFAIAFAGRIAPACSGRSPPSFA